MRTDFVGHDELRAVFNAGFAALLATFVLSTALANAGVAFVVWYGIIALTAVSYFGTRYRCSVGPGGVELRRYLGWFVCVKTERFRLDCRPDLYEAWGSDRAEGVCLVSASPGDGESDVFGPYFNDDAMTALQDALGRTIASTQRTAGRLTAGR